MGDRRRLISVAALALALAAGCKRAEKAPAPAPAPTTDHLAKGEIPEGRERAFTLPLPLHSSIKAQFGASVHVASPHTLDELSEFVRARVKDGTITSAPTETRFDRVVVAGDPTRTLDIQVRAAPMPGEYRSQLVVNDVTPEPEEPGTTDAERWRKAGMTPDGRLLDPNHMQ